MYVCADMKDPGKTLVIEAHQQAIMSPQYSVTQQMMSRAHNWPVFLQILSVLTTLLGGMNLLIGMGSVSIQTERSPDIVTHGHEMRMDILWYLILTALVYCGDMMAC